MISLDHSRITTVVDVAPADELSPLWEIAATDYTGTTTHYDGETGTTLAETIDDLLADDIDHIDLTLWMPK
ncbi:hypothetical protein JVX90_00050 [Gordonia sp. PDNC005]|uniref:hypothetical protein n=1 Tax=Gordonia sp. PDNC005 TaxID=2811424 RepID=UPI001965424F|nr:hypothetical protein [Gordonia sp. PDNC005]QRY62704.1 hypothetical protein JVX90_00050 [Gordonia sp. PDNC005]